MKFLRWTFPVTAIIFAVSTVLVTNANSKAALATVEVSYRGGVCQVDGYCTEGGILQCKAPGGILLDLFTPGLPAPTCTAYSANGTFHTN
jgi:hypothetical protein